VENEARKERIRKKWKAGQSMTWKEMEDGKEVGRRGEGCAATAAESSWVG
jgi:hypothetical protein